MSIPGFILNIPNMISFSRIILIPLFVYLLFQRTVESWFLAVVVFGIASLTDLLDGWSARKLNQESEFGKFIDPIADKILVISSLIAIILMDPAFEIFDFWMILIIVGRDVLITAMRYLAIKKGKPLRTNRFGKFKTAFQMVSIVIIIMIYIIQKKGVFVTYKSIPYWIMVGVTVLTALSGARYLITNWNLFFPDKNNKNKDKKIKNEI